MNKLLMLLALLLGLVGIIPATQAVDLVGKNVSVQDVTIVAEDDKCEDGKCEDDNERNPPR